MSPTLRPGSVVLVLRYFSFFKPHIGDIIACKSPRNKKIIIKRITKIKNNQYFVQGDNKAASTDSRDFGMLIITKIVGKVIYVL
jgi:nickel-type superoxide dismutase maturation protease